MRRWIAGSASLAAPVRCVRIQGPWGWVLAVTLGVATAAWGDESEVDSIRLRSLPLPGQILGVEGCRALPARAVRGTLMVYGEAGPVYRVVDGVRTDPIIAHRFVGDLAAAVGLGHRMSLWADLPFVAYQRGRWPDEVTALPTTGPGDLLLGGHVVLLDPDRSPVGIGIVPALQVPTGVRGAFLSSRVLELHAKAGLEVPFGPGRVTAALGARLRPSSEWSDVETASAFVFGFGGEIRLHDRWRIQLAMAGEVSGAEWSRPVEIRGGGSYRTLRGLDLTAFLAGGVAPGVGSPDVRVGLQLDLDVMRWAKDAAVVEDDDVPVDAPPAVYGGTGAHPAPPDGRETASSRVELLVATPIRFAPGETRLSDDAKDALLELAAYLRGHGELGSVVVLGHGDPDGGAVYNARLSWRRAVATRAFLVEVAGVDEGRLHVPSSRAADASAEEEDRPVDRESVAFIVATSDSR